MSFLASLKKLLRIKDYGARKTEPEPPPSEVFSSTPEALATTPTPAKPHQHDMSPTRRYARGGPRRKSNPSRPPTGHVTRKGVCTCSSVPRGPHKMKRFPVVRAKCCTLCFKIAPEKIPVA